MTGAFATTARVTAVWSALLLRDLRALVRSRSQLSSSVLFPLMLLAILGVGISRGLEPSRVREGDYVSFLVPGIIVMTTLFSSTFSSASFYQDRDTGMLKLFFVSPHPPGVILTGKALGAVVVGSVQAFLVLGIAAAIPAIDLVWRYGVLPSLALAVATVLLLAVLLNGVAQLLATRIQTMQGFHLVMNLVFFPLLFFSGAFFPLDDLPGWLYGLALANPLTYAVDLLQLALYATDGAEYLGIGVDLPVLVGLAALTHLWGMRRRPIPAP
jgi:ABC-2 type transport system permease protein